LKHLNQKRLLKLMSQQSRAIVGNFPKILVFNSFTSRPAMLSSHVVCEGIFWFLSWNLTS